MNNYFLPHVKQMLLLGKKVLRENPTLTQEVGKTNYKGQRIIGMDVKMEEALIDYVRRHKLPVSIFSEEIGVLQSHPNPTHILVFDPLDGSTNYKIGKNQLPYGVLIAFYKGSKPKLKSIVASGAYEATTGRGWIYDGKITKTLNGEKVALKASWEISKSTPVYLDLYYKKAYEYFHELPENVHVRWNGSTISSLMYVLNEVGATMGSIQMRPEEIGAIVSLISGAGGAVLDFDGNDLRDRLFLTDKTYEILAGNKLVTQFVLRRLHR